MVKLLFWVRVRVSVGARARLRLSVRVPVRVRVGLELVLWLGLGTLPMFAIAFLKLYVSPKLLAMFQCILTTVLE